MTLYTYTYTFPYRFTVNEVLPSRSASKPQSEPQKAEEVRPRKHGATVVSTKYKCTFCMGEFSIESTAKPSACPVCGLKYSMS
jgi:rubrerythrin